MGKACFENLFEILAVTAQQLQDLSSCAYCHQFVLRKLGHFT